MALQQQRTEVLGTSMARVETGSGDPIALLHGGPTSSSPWRDAIAHLEPLEQLRVTGR